MDEQKCQLIEITRGTTHDGPGLRTTVFLKGCPLSCRWCQNPEGMSFKQNVWWEKRKCIRCLACIEACAQGALHEEADGIVRDPERCTLCGECVEACPSQARSFTGQAWSLEDLVKEALKDKEYYQAFGGGVTVSGGEPLSQYPFVAEFFKRLHQAGVSTALDTCGLASETALEAVLPHTDLVLFDIKLLDPALHKQFTGQSNEIILKNLSAIAGYLRKTNAGRRTESEHAMRLWIRTPLIPDTTATPENISAISHFICQNLPDVVERWELCAFNSACKSKYEKLGISWTYDGYSLMPQSLISSLKTAALSSGMQSEKLVVTGLVAK